MLKLSLVGHPSGAYYGEVEFSPVFPLIACHITVSSGAACLMNGSEAPGVSDTVMSLKGMLCFRIAARTSDDARCARSCGQCAPPQSAGTRQVCLNTLNIDWTGIPGLPCPFTEPP